jgi:hypothetical protein
MGASDITLNDVLSASNDGLVKRFCPRAGVSYYVFASSKLTLHAEPAALLEFDSGWTANDSS